jgi:GNAT superfamily N-acetyltransferase
MKVGLYLLEWFRKSLRQTVQSWAFSGGPNSSNELKGDYASELGAIYLLKEYQGRGIGKNLVKRFVTELLHRNFNSMLVWVLEKNPYRRFYESLGGTRITSVPIQIGSEPFEKVAYGWKTLDGLID